MKFIANGRTFLIGLWIGAACFFSFAVAPSAFAVLSSREIAGSMVNRTLMVVNFSGIVIGLILLGSSYLSAQNISRVKLWIEQGTLLLLTAACAFGQFIIAARLHNLREQIGRPIDEVLPDDPLRLAFNDLHSYSVTILSVAMIAAIISFFLLAGRAGNSKNS